MPENHEHSRYIYNSYYYDGHRLDPSDLDLKAYVDARIAANPSPGGSSYLVYDAAFAQSGASAPTPTVRNSADSNYLGAVTWGRATPSANVVYTVTKTGAFPNANKISVFLTHDNWNTGVAIGLGWTWIDANTIYITPMNLLTGSYVDCGGTYNSIEIKVYQS